MKTIKITEQQAKLLKEMGENPSKVLKVSQEQYNMILEMERIGEVMVEEKPNPEILDIYEKDGKIILVNNTKNQPGITNRIEATLGPVSMFSCKNVYASYDDLFESNELTEGIYDGSGKFKGNLLDTCPVNVKEDDYAGRNVSKGKLPSSQINNGPDGFTRNLDKGVKSDMGKLYEEFIHELYGVNESSEGKYKKLISLMEVAGLVKNGRLKKEKFNEDKDKAMAVISRGIHKMEEGGSAYSAMESIEEALKSVKDITPDYFNKQISQKSSNGDKSSIADKRASELQRRKDSGEPAEYHDGSERKEAISAMARREQEEKPEREATSNTGKQLEEDGEEAMTVNIGELDIIKHGRLHNRNHPEKILYVPTATDVTSGLFQNEGGFKSLEEWKQLMSSKYGVKTVIVKDGKVTVNSNQLQQDKDTYVNGKAGMLGPNSNEGAVAGASINGGSSGPYTGGNALGGQTHKFTADEIIPEAGVSDVEVRPETEQLFSKVLELLSSIVNSVTIYPNHLLGQKENLLRVAGMISQIDDSEKPRNFIYLERTGIPKLIVSAEKSLEGDEKAFSIYADRLNDVFTILKNAKRDLFGEGDIDETTMLGGPSGINSKVDGNNIEHDVDAWNTSPFMKAGNKLNKHEQVSEDYVDDNMDKPTRYVAEMDFYLWAKSDDEAKGVAKGMAGEMDSKYDNQPRIQKLYKQPQGTLGNTPVNEDAHTTPQYKGGKIISPKDKCSKFPYCNQGPGNFDEITSKDAVVANDHMFEDIAKKTGRPLAEVKSIVEGYANSRISDSIETIKHTNSIIEKNPNAILEFEDEGSRFLAIFTPIEFDEEQQYAKMKFKISHDGKTWKDESKTRSLPEKVFNNKYSYEIQNEDCALIQAGMYNHQDGMATNMNNLKGINKEIS